MPTPQVKRPQMGQHFVVGTITGLIAGNDGTLTPGIVLSFTTQRRSIRLSEGVVRTEINTAGAKRANEVIQMDEASLSIDIFLVNNTADPNPLSTLYAGYDYFLVQYTVGTVPGSIETIVGYFVRGNLDTSMEGREVHMATAEFGPCDPGFAQVTRNVS